MHAGRFLLAPGVRVCRYSVTCSEYAEWQLRTRPLHKALWATLVRLLSCHPLAGLWGS